MKSRSSIVILLISIMLISCGSSRDKLEGTWIVDDVNAQMDPGSISNEMLQRSLDMEKSIQFMLFANDSMQFIMDTYSTPGTWSFDSKTKKLYYRIGQGLSIDSTLLGIYVDGKIVKENKADAGIITTTYRKK